ncbi:hypothetical protein [Brevundimonas sp.]|uniref:hypothetical protein n=1 Tax=Brevundimonas sp. TaxID=1871086 RepID=UPI0035B14C0D
MTSTTNITASAFSTAIADLRAASDALARATDTGQPEETLEALTNERADKVFAVLAAPAVTLADLEQKIAVALIAAHAETDEEQDDHMLIARRVIAGRTFDDGRPLGQLLFDVIAMRSTTN